MGGQEVPRPARLHVHRARAQIHGRLPGWPVQARGLIRVGRYGSAPSRYAVLPGDPPESGTVVDAETRFIAWKEKNRERAAVIATKIPAECRKRTVDPVLCRFSRHRLRQTVARRAHSLVGDKGFPARNPAILAGLGCISRQVTQIRTRNRTLCPDSYNERALVPESRHFSRQRVAITTRAAATWGVVEG